MEEEPLCSYARDLQVLQYLRSEEPYGRWGWDSRVCAVAAERGDLEMLKWARSQEVVEYGEGGPCPWDSDTCLRAAEAGHLNILQWARSQNPPCKGGGSCSAAAKGGQLEVLKWLRSQDPPCGWSAFTCTSAAASGHLDVLQWLISEGCPWRRGDCIGRAGDGGHTHVLR